MLVLGDWRKPLIRMDFALVENVLTARHKIVLELYFSQEIYLVLLYKI